jgi:hypothetical protein
LRPRLAKYGFSEEVLQETVEEVIFLLPENLQHGGAM